MFIMLHKLKDLKKFLKTWNTSVFGDIHKRLESAKSVLSSIQQDISNNGISDLLFNREVEAKSKVLECLKEQHHFWRDKSRTKWLLEGALNFFMLMLRLELRNLTSLVSVAILWKILQSFLIIL